MKKIILVALAISLLFTYSQAINSSSSILSIALKALLGESGKLKIVLCTPDAPIIQDLLPDLQLITLIPFSLKQNGRIGKYILGNWPFEKNGAASSIASAHLQAYANPVGFIKVTPENRDLQVSEHFKLGDFLTKDQPNVWPKYMLLATSLIDKLELIIDELKRKGCSIKHMAIMSGFRTPRYNKEGGNTGGRGKLSRHMYGDASDIFVDNDQDGWTDDINNDGRVDIHDAEFLAQAAEHVETQHPTLVGGIGIYSTGCGHGPFIHVDVRGWKARWRGSNG